MVIATGLGVNTSILSVLGIIYIQYMGFWYEIEATPQIWEIGGRCPTADYSLDAATSRVNVTNSMRTM